MKCQVSGVGTAWRGASRGKQFSGGRVREGSGVLFAGLSEDWRRSRCLQQRSQLPLFKEIPSFNRPLLSSQCAKPWPGGWGYQNG